MCESTDAFGSERRLNQLEVGDVLAGGMRFAGEGDSADDVAGLSRAFNRMTGQIAEQRAELMNAYGQIDERRRFTETVLAGVSAGAPAAAPPRGHAKRSAAMVAVVTDDGAEGGAGGIGISLAIFLATAEVIGTTRAYVGEGTTLTAGELDVTATILGQWLLLGRPVLLAYAIVFLAVTYAFVRGYEEPALTARYGEEYVRYRERVPGWWPRRIEKT